jgi:hypothetical protein
MKRVLLWALSGITLLIGPQIVSAQTYATGKNGQTVTTTSSGTDASGNVNAVANGVYPSAMPSLLPGQPQQLTVDQNGYLNVHVQRGTATAAPAPMYPAPSASPFPVTPATTFPISAATTLPIGGSVGITNFPTTQPVSIATTVPVNCVSGCSSGSGTGGPVYPAPLTSPFPIVASTTIPTHEQGTIPVTGTFFQALQPVSIATLPPITGTVNVGNFPTYPTPPATQTINGTVNVGNFPATQPVSGTFFQATQPVSIASPVAVTGSFYQTTQPVSISAPVSVTGSFYQATQPVSIATLPPIGGAVSVTNFPTPVPLQNVAITSGLSAKYSIMATAGTYVVKNTAAVFLGIANLSTSVQITAVACYDNASAASGSLLVNTALGLSPPWFPSGGIATNNGLTCTVPLTLLGAGVAVYYR